MYFNRVNNFAIISFHKIRKLLGYMMQSSFEHLNNFFIYIYNITNKNQSLYIHFCQNNFASFKCMH